MGLIRVLFLADTHLGFDLPSRPRVERRRRGPDFFANTERALEPALKGEADFVVHGGDLLYRSRVPAHLVDAAFAPLRRVADSGVPVLLVPGNHERSHVPRALLAQHPNIHIFDRARTVAFAVRGNAVAFGGFPCVGDGIRERFTELLAKTGSLSTPADVRLLCVHECFEGATVGPADFVFRDASNVVRGADVPRGFAAVLSGHIHRAQTLSADLHRRPLAAPVLYPGSIERTSTAERDEPKGCLRLEFAADQSTGGRLVSSEFIALPARPMLVECIRAGGEVSELQRRVREVISRAPLDAVLSLRISGSPTPAELKFLQAASLRLLAPPTMNLSCALLSRPGASSA